MRLIRDTPEWAARRQRAEARANEQLHPVWADAVVMFPRSPVIMAEMHAWAIAQRNSSLNQDMRGRLGIAPLV